MKNKISHLAAWGFGVVTAVAATCYWPSTSRAQLLVDTHYSYGIYQGGDLVGEIMRVDRSTTSYKEHWVLYPEYEYGVEMEIVPGETYYDDLHDFFDDVPFSSGSRYVEATCADGTRLPE
jgi:hypothetical protein